MRQREKVYGDSLPNARSFSSTPHPYARRSGEAAALYALTNRIRLTASQPVLTEAEHLLSHITDQYFSRNLTVPELRELAHSAGGDPLRAFSEACRTELKSIRARM